MGAGNAHSKQASWHSRSSVSFVGRPRATGRRARGRDGARVDAAAGRRARRPSPPWARAWRYLRGDRRHRWGSSRCASDAGGSRFGGFAPRYLEPRAPAPCATGGRGRRLGRGRVRFSGRDGGPSVFGSDGARGARGHLCGASAAFGCLRRVKPAPRSRLRPYFCTSVRREGGGSARPGGLVGGRDAWFAARRGASADIVRIGRLE